MWERLTGFLQFHRSRSSNWCRLLKGLITRGSELNKKSGGCVMSHLCSYLWLNMKLLAIRSWTHTHTHSHFFFITEISKRTSCQAAVMHLNLYAVSSAVLWTISPTSVVFGCLVESHEFCTSDCINMSRVTTNYWFSVLEDFGAKCCCAFGNTAAQFSEVCFIPLRIEFNNNNNNLRIKLLNTSIRGCDIIFCSP